MKTTRRRRRKENRTDYGRRIKLLKSQKPRIVFRKTNRYVIAQYITSSEAQDKINFGVNSKHLIKYGWPEKFNGSLKSIPASYLIGYLIGKQIIKKKLETPIVDVGMIRALHKTKIYSFTKGLIDSGIELKHDKKIFPSEDSIQGKNLKEDFSTTFNEIKSKIDKE